MRIVKLFVLATFLFAATAYSYQGTSSTLRTPVMSATGDGTKRIEEATEAIAEQTPGLMDRVKALFLSDWEKLVYAKFTGQFLKHKIGNSEGPFAEGVLVMSRDEALWLLKPLVKTLSRNHSNLKDEISAIVEAANNIDELKLVIEIKNIFIENGVEANRGILALAKVKGTTEKRQEAFERLLSLNQALKNNGLYTSWTFREAIPALVEAAKTADDLKLFLYFGIQLAGDIGREPGKAKQDVGPTLYGISQTARIANDIAEQMDLCKTIEALNKGLFWLITTDLAKLAKFNSAIAVSVTNIKELNQVKDVVMPQIMKEAKDPRALRFITPENIKAASEEQKKGGFVIAIEYKPADKKSSGSKDTYKITISPFPAWANKEKLASNTSVAIPYDKLDHVVLMAQSGVENPASFKAAIGTLLGNKISNIFVVALEEKEIQELKTKIGTEVFEDMVRKGIKFTVPESSVLNGLRADMEIYQNSVFDMQGVKVFNLIDKKVIDQLNASV